MIVKICGLMSVRDAEAANAAGPDWAGIVLHEPSRRCVDASAARAIRSALDPSIPLVGVTVDRDPSFVEGLARDGVIQMVQVHASSDEAYVERMRGIGLPLIRAFVVRSKDDVERAASCDADYVMVDAGLGSGRTFDWSLMDDAGFPFILSGGLDPGNVSDAVCRLRPIGVDVSSGVETDGRKDPAKMAAFVANARSARSSRSSCFLFFTRIICHLSF